MKEKLLLPCIAFCFAANAQQAPLEQLSNVKYAIVETAENNFLIGGAFTNNSTPFGESKICLLNNDLTFNDSFHSGLLGGSSNDDYYVRSIAKNTLAGPVSYYLGGNMVAYSGLPVNDLVRVFANGSRDTGFPSITTSSASAINSVVVQPDGKVIAGGSFTTINGTTKSRIVRFNSDGTIDPTFGAGFNGTVRSLALQPDGKIIVGGDFTAFTPSGAASVSRYKVARLLANGNIDLGFSAVNYGLDSSVNAVALQEDGKVLLGGNFTSWGNMVPDAGSERPVRRIKIARLNSDGLLDMTFNPGLGFTEISNSINYAQVYTLSQYKSDRIFVGGYFTEYNGTPRKHICMLNMSDGSLVTSFDPGIGPETEVYGHRIEDAGTIVIVGQFQQFNNLAVNGVKRITVTGAGARFAETEAMPLGKAVASGFTATPNPASNNVAISLPGGKIKGVTLNSIDGKQLYRAAVSELESVELDITPYESGILLLNVETSGGEVIPAKLIKK